jgi:hypothetical protein
MPLPSGTRYRYKKGTDVRLAFAKGSNKVIEAKNMSTGKTHTPSEFARDRAKRKMKSKR